MSEKQGEHSASPHCSRPCPFCGSRDVSIASESTVTGFMMYWVDCDKCEAQGPMCASDSTAVKQWDKRSV